MTKTQSVSDHWATGDVFGRILEAIKAAGLSPDAVTVEQLAPVDHLHARGFPATKELADALPVKAGDRLVDIGCGVGGPARYMAQRFGCEVDGVDITPAFVEAANRLTEMVGLQDRVRIVLGDGQSLPFDDDSFDGGYAQHVTMNVPDRKAFFAEAFRVLKPGAFFALTEHGLGPKGSPIHPVPWSDDGTGAFLAPPAETAALLEGAGFTDIELTDTGEKYVKGYRRALDLAERGELPPFGHHILLGGTALEKMGNAARNIDEGRTHPIQVICRKPG